MNTQKVGIFGAAFDPPTLGHYDALNQALAHFDKILLVPSVSHAFGKHMTDMSHRKMMLNIFLQHWPHGVPIDIENIEEKLIENNKPVYTYDVMQALEKKFPHAALTFIIGPDNKKNWGKFYKHHAIVERWDLYEVEERIPLHSIHVRSFIKDHHQDNSFKTQLSHYVGQPIAEYIIQNKLYF